MHINELLTTVVELGGSDLHLKVGNFPIARVKGRLMPLTQFKRLVQEDTIAMAYSIMATDRQKTKFKDNLDIDLAYSVPALGRFRCNIFNQRGTVGMVLRVIPRKIFSIADLMLPRVLERICEEQRGLVLVTGTTGSGKSTTLAAMIDLINATRVEHILTIEDPIEYLHRDNLSIINQREVEADCKSFSSALRAALRQDPDVILVGEMRDLETIETALHAAETGHLVFSTLHTNSAPETITRLLDMGIDPLNFADALLGILAQRLIRTLCKNCKEAYHPTLTEYEEMVESYGPELFAIQNIPYTDNMTLYRPKGCDICDKSGYKGRVGIHELLVGTDEIKRLIQKHATVEDMRNLAIEQGMTTLLQDGILKSIQGITDFKQVRRVCIK